jgi:hypothetical protein
LVAQAQDDVMAINPFIDDYLPNMFWPALLATFGRQVTYLPQGTASQAVPITILWKEGANDEEVSPGRYSHIDVENAALPPGTPKLGDQVMNNGKTYNFVRVNALAIGFSTIVLQDGGPII